MNPQDNNKNTEKEIKKKHYISGKESRNIAKQNTKTIKELQSKRKKYKREDYVTEMRDPKNIVEFDDLHTYFFTDNGTVKAVNGVSFDIPQGSTVGVVGESGCGKSVTSLSLMQLVQGPMGQIVSGSIRFRSTVRTPMNEPLEPVMVEKLDSAGKPVLDADGNPVMEQALDAKGKPKFNNPNIEPIMIEKLDEDGDPIFDEDGNPIIVQAKDKLGRPKFKKKFVEHEEVFDIAKMPISDMSSIRGREIAMIFQEPMTSLNPVFTIGYQLDEVTLLHVKGSVKAEAKKRSIEMLKLVGIAMPEHVYKSYPHQLSGGMRQRVMIAMALCCNPKLIIADEPTTALDVTIQAQILDLLREVKNKISGSIMLITHDLGVIAEMVDYVVVMYAGRVVEKGTVSEIFKYPLHPYTIGLQKSKPVVGKSVDRLYSIPGNVPNPINMLSTCYFKGRCNMRCAACKGDYPEMIRVSPTHYVACHRYDGMRFDPEAEENAEQNLVLNEETAAENVEIAVENAEHVEVNVLNAENAENVEAVENANNVENIGNIENAVENNAVNAEQAVQTTENDVNTTADTAENTAAENPEIAADNADEKETPAAAEKEKKTAKTETSAKAAGAKKPAAKKTTSAAKAAGTAKPAEKSEKTAKTAAPAKAEGAKKPAAKKTTSAKKPADKAEKTDK